MQDLVKSNGRKYTVLVIEDEEVQRTVLSEKISRAGFEVYTALDGTQGLNKAVANEPDIILLDNRMPKMGGFEMLTRLRETSAWGESVPVIFFSNVEPSSRKERDDIATIGAAHYLLKSETSLEDIVAKIKEVLYIA